jgi:phospholipase/lecithinase/hemolysin
VFDAISDFRSNPFEALVDIAATVVNVDKFVVQLAAHGARNLLVLTVPDIGKTPAYASEGSAASFTASALPALFDRELTVSLQTIAAAKGLLGNKCFKEVVG